jgi:hypothetical protein
MPGLAASYLGLRLASGSLVSGSPGLEFERVHSQPLVLYLVDSGVAEFLLALETRSFLLGFADT